MAALTPSALPYSPGTANDPPPPYHERLDDTEKKTNDIAVQVILQTSQEREALAAKEALRDVLEEVRQALDKPETEVSRECQELLDKSKYPRDVFNDPGYETPDELKDLSDDQQEAIAQAKEDAFATDERAAQNDALLDIGLKKRDLAKVYLAAHHGTPAYVENTRDFLRDALAILNQVDIEYLKDQQNNDQDVGYDL